MYKKNTDELEEMLEKTHPTKVAEFLDSNSEYMLSEDRNFMNYMNEKLKEKKISKQEVFLKADISQGYGYKLLTEEKVTRQRDVILRICYAAEFTLQEVQQALKIYHMNTLYVRDARDALIMTCFNERPGSIMDVNELLYNNHMKPLRSSGLQD